MLPCSAAGLFKRLRHFLSVTFRCIYTRIVLGTALLNFGTRANSFGHGSLYLHSTMCSCFFNVDFWNGTPQTRTESFTFDFRRAFAGYSMADSQIQKAIVSLVALKKRKRLSQFRDEKRSSLAPLKHVLRWRNYALTSRRHAFFPAKSSLFSTPEPSPLWSVMWAKTLGTKIPPVSARGPLFRRAGSTS